MFAGLAQPVKHGWRTSGGGNGIRADRERDLNGGMADYLDDNQTEGPEGYFIQGAATAKTGRRDRRGRGAGRRRTDAESQRSRQRLGWAFGAASVMLVAAVVAAVTRDRYGGR
jgi:hypothetical protein